MRRSNCLPRSRRMAGQVFVVTALALIAVGTLTACKGSDGPNTEAGAILSTGTVQAPMPAADASTAGSASVDTTGATTGTVVAGGTIGGPATGGGAAIGGATAANPGAATPKIWLARVGSYAKAVKSPVWYPGYLTKGFKADSTDVVELDKGTGLVCDVVFLNGEKVLQFTQGSPKERSYPVESEGKVPWGTEKADVMRLDPEDPASPYVIVYNHGGNFAELQGDVSLDELKRVAASMVLVK